MREQGTRKNGSTVKRVMQIATFMPDVTSVAIATGVADTALTKVHRLLKKRMHIYTSFLPGALASITTARSNGKNQEHEGGVCKGGRVCVCV